MIYTRIVVRSLSTKLQHFFFRWPKFSFRDFANADSSYNKNIDRLLSIDAEHHIHIIIIKLLYFPHSIRSESSHRLSKKIKSTSARITRNSLYMVPVPTLINIYYFIYSQYTYNIYTYTERFLMCSRTDTTKEN